MFLSLLKNAAVLGTASFLALFLCGCQTVSPDAQSKNVFQSLVDSHKKYGASLKDWPVHEFQTMQIQSDVIIVPRYSPKLFAPYTRKIIQIANGRFPIYEIETNRGRKISLIQVGVGACNTLDAVLALAATPCRKILFIGSVGSLSADAHIGDIIVPSESVCGCGADLYITTESFLKSDAIGKSYASDLETSMKLRRTVKKISRKKRLTTSR